MLIFAFVLGIFVLGLANAFSDVDLSVSSLFCERLPSSMAPRICDGFPLSNYTAVVVTRKILLYIPPLALAVLVCMAFFPMLRREPTLSTHKARSRLNWDALDLVLAYFLGTILIVNGILKEWSGRPRPVQTLPFGGDMMFVRAGDFSGACTSNCSFVSGEAAAAGWLLCLIPMIGWRRHPRICKAITAMSITTPVLRIAMGGHFASDVILGWIIGAAAYPTVVVIRATLMRSREIPSLNDAGSVPETSNP